MMSLLPQRIERLAGELAACNDQAVWEAIKPYDVDTRLAIKLAIGMQRQTRGIQAQAHEPAAVPEASANGEASTI
jgi:hypothetical protein